MTHKYTNVSFVGRSAVIIALVFALSSCTKEGPVDNSTLIDMTVGNYLSDTNAEAYLVATDTLNQVLASSIIQNNATTSLAPVDGYYGATINAYVVKHIGSNLFIDAYLNIRRGSSWDFTPKPPAQAPHGNIKINFKNVVDFDYLTYGTNFQAHTLINSNFSDTTTYGTHFVYEGTGKVFVQLAQNGIGYYKVVDIEEGKISYDIDLSSLSENMEKTLLYQPETASSSQYSLVGVDPGPPESSYFLFSGYLNAVPYSIFVPPGIATTFYATCNAKIGDRNYIYTNIGPTIPSNYEPLSFDADISDPSLDHFLLTPIHAYDRAKFYFDHTNQSSRITVYASYYTYHFAIPDFSSILPIPSFAPNDFHLTYYDLIDDFGLQETQQYFNYYSTWPPPSSSSTQTVGVQF